MHKKIVYTLAVLAGLMLNQAYGQLFNDDVYKFSKVLGLVNNYYVDSVDRSQLVETAVVEMLKELDPHSTYWTKEQAEKANEELQGNFEGIGVQFNILNDTLIVVSPISGGPSEKVGILAGDRIVRIDTENVAGIGLTNQMVFDRLRGEKGTKVTVGIKRKGVDEILEFEIIRDKIPKYSLDAAYMVNENTAYLKLNRFAATTMNEYNEAMEKLTKEGAENIILDLTNNGGGYLNMAFELADHFLEPGQMVVYTKGLKSPRQEYKAKSSSKKEKGKVVVMIDQGSASASEIVTGAIQDWDRGVVVGRRSFGKGLVQRPFNLPDGSMMRLTIARYYTPTGRLIQKSYDEGVEEYHKDLINRYNNGELMSKDSAHFADSLKYNTLKNNRVVYGGGGIMPDIFVPIDTSTYSDYYRDLIRKGIINRFVLRYVDDNRKDLEKEYLGRRKNKDFSYFKENFLVTEEFLTELTDYAEEKGVELDEEDYEKSKEHIQKNLKALVARDLFDTSEFFEVINELDPIYQEAVKVIEDDKRYQSKLLPSR